MKIKLAIAAAAASLIVAAAPAAAAEVTFTGSTGGCFTTTACSPTPGPSSVGNLLYVSGAFTGTTVDGLLSIGNGIIGNNFGTFSLGTGAFDYNPYVFDLGVLFSSPSGTSPNPYLTSADLVGRVTTLNNGGVTVDFNNNWQNFTFNGGTFQFQLNDVDLSAGSANVALTGRFRAAVPEPSTWAMMLVGFGAVGFGMRRRGAKSNAIRLQAA